MSRSARKTMFAVAAVLAVVLAVLGFRAASGRRMAAYRAELRAAGEKLSLAELEETATVPSKLLDQLIARTAWMPRLRLHPGSLELRQYKGPGLAFVTWKQQAPKFYPPSIGTNQPTWAELENELRKAQDVLEAARELADEAPARTDTPIAASKPFVALRTGAQLLAGKAVCDLRARDLPAVAGDLKALAGLAQVNRDEFSLVSQMIRMAIAGLGLTATWEALQAEGWTDAQLADVQRAWEEIELIPGLEKGLLGDRAFVLDAWQELRKTGRGAFTTAQLSGPNGSVQSALEETLFVPAYRITLANDDELFFLKTSQQNLEAIRQLRTNVAWNVTKGRLDEVASRLNRAFTGFGRWRYPMSQMGAANSSRAARRVVQTETERRLTIAAIAVMRYRLAHGRYPSGLGELVPEFLREPLVDPMSAEPFGYRVGGGGEFTLYSAGEDGSDDGGDAKTNAGRLELWEGKDAVWPREVVERGPGS